MNSPQVPASLPSPLLATPDERTLLMAGYSMGQLSNAPDLPVTLSIQLLSKIALNPERGNRAYAFLTPSESGPDHILVDLPLHAVKNPVGPFLVIRSGPAYRALLRAVEANLASRHFRAARACFRARVAYGARVARIEAAARQAQNEAARRLQKTSFSAEGLPDWISFGDDWFAARGAYRVTFDELYGRYRKRLLALSAAAQDPGWHDAVVSAEGQLGLRRIGRPA